MYKRWSQTGFTKVTCIPAKIPLKRNPFYRRTNYIRPNTFKICIEITNQTFPYDSKVQNTTSKGIQTAFIHHSVSGTECTDISKTQTKFVLFLFLPPLVKYIMYT